MEKAGFGAFASQILQFTFVKLLLVGLGIDVFKRLAIFTHGIVDASDFVGRALGAPGERLLGADARFEATIESAQGRIRLND